MSQYQKPVNVTQMDIILFLPFIIKYKYLKTSYPLIPLSVPVLTSTHTPADLHHFIRRDTRLSRTNA